VKTCRYAGWAIYGMKGIPGCSDRGQYMAERPGGCNCLCLAKTNTFSGGVLWES